jgi:hypothetical protein
MIIERDNYPHLRDAFHAIEYDSGGHLIGRVYPGTPIDLERFAVPEPWAHLVAGADRGLGRLQEQGDSDFETFVIGEQSEAEAIERRQGDLAEARILLNDMFNGCQPEDAPFRHKTGCPSGGFGPCDCKKSERS